MLYDNYYKVLKFADVAKLVYALDLGSSGKSCAGSSPVIRTSFLTYKKLDD